MSEKWNPLNPEVLKSWIDAILNEASDDLSDWESKFIVDVEMRLARGSQLTQSQEQKLEEIYADKTS